MAKKVTLVPIDVLRIPNDGTDLPLLRDETYLVSEYAAAMRVYGGWGEFPPALIDQEMLILGGVTRVRAASKVGVTEVPVRIRECKTTVERLLAAAEDNSANSKRWDSQAITQMVVLADKLDLDREELAYALRVPVRRVQRVPISTVIRTPPDGNPYRAHIYTKRAVRRSLLGREVTEEQEAIMRALSTPHVATRVVKDLLRLAELDALPPLDIESRADVALAIGVLSGWLSRDEHLFATTA